MTEKAKWRQQYESRCAYNPNLTEAERLVIQDIVDNGYNTKRLQERLDITQSTYKTHARHIMMKLGVDNITDAVITAIKQGIVEIEIRRMATC